ncbi:MULTISPECIES: cbb3-type cytochrome c oxidase subunit 3 [unclassified Phenylobacterium]|jgi:cytochrome c oxidase cbb3-type subunit 4|uniref:cbb3-type cytochrome c oxidase subunit 3 n=1 Tax=unclassified Phenylobacterium TaxID=2640670 RepID=UPI00226429F2|nr:MULTISPECIES: cbb3-type cytochrome c oxidase subunit 3 [unclassified Phenylobacterium]MBS0491600.1 cbb3-type cytochrome c oxidase subunit 3 [Pseudomonadota bacterium]MCX7585292.1 cbb3-type cytochrome c oxidase subunit 3 [Phenylobacterium sp. 58.2.17]WGU38411.1 cbb3-type cytochrome c oxidase subunit 3 [Phenylobacterium sp. NIBR 498073]
MSDLTYETVARFAQQGGLIYFGLIFACGVVYALWPRNREAFKRLASLPLQDDEAPDVQA